MLAIWTLPITVFAVLIAEPTSEFPTWVAVFCTAVCIVAALGAALRGEFRNRR